MDVLGESCFITSLMVGNRQVNRFERPSLEFVEKV